MKIRTSLMIVSSLFFLTNSTSVLADKAPLENDIETPDTLLQTANPDKKKASYGEDNIVISGDGAKNNEITKSDPILSTVEKKTQSTSKDIRLEEKNITESDKAIETDDPLLRLTKEKKPAVKDKPSHKNNFCWKI